MESKIENQYPVIITEHLLECKKFYTEIFDFKVIFEEEWYIQLKNDNGIELGFMLPNLENQPKFLRDVYSGNGVIFSFEVENAKEEYERLKKKDIKFLLEYKIEEWGQKHFIIRDPAGVYLDIVEITTAEDY